jgi:glycogen(starch) synthase
MEVYAGVRGTKPDNGFDPVLPRDPDCRFRAAPHLL